MELLDEQLDFVWNTEDEMCESKWNEQYGELLVEFKPAVCLRICIFI
jgi:hypothetical protein